MQLRFTFTFYKYKLNKIEAEKEDCNVELTFLFKGTVCDVRLWKVAAVVECLCFDPRQMFKAAQPS